MRIKARRTRSYCSVVRSSRRNACLWSISGAYKPATQVKTTSDNKLCKTNFSRTQFFQKFVKKLLML